MLYDLKPFQHKQLLSACLTTMLILIMLALPFSVSAQPSVAIEIDGEPLAMDVAPVIEAGRVLVPVAPLMRALGAEVQWQPENRQVIIEHHSDRVVLTIDSAQAAFNDALIQLQVPARILEGRTLVPLRFVSETLQANVRWDEVNRMVRVTTQEIPFQPRSIPFTVVNESQLAEIPGLSAWVDSHRMTMGIHVERDIDSGTVFLMAAGGERSTGGYRMEVLSLREEAAGEAVLEAELEMPAPEDMVTQALTYPAQLIRFDADGITDITGTIRELRRGTREVTLYFMRVTDTAFLTEGESRLFQTKDLTPDDLLAVLLAGPESADLTRVIPRNAKVLNISVSDGLANVNFSREITQANVGAEAEGVLVNSIVWTLVQLPEIDAVQILVEGEIVETLAGHITVNEPLSRQ
ncbi:stalk domain-containing protein [Anoxynatronum buryatiense]|uniref:PrcB C-terminal n=1 Tax=Anoxynatronum buryatiense TaxID=489973 RepID=A0AA45WTM9_9CLOT|nr:stalk domain-containing protein [Anoxynatronum buryatiense]SMP43226.1 PrcB C-terminal [Anoxynatronum buryatiense]